MREAMALTSRVTARKARVISRVGKKRSTHGMATKLPLFLPDCFS